MDRMIGATLIFAREESLSEPRRIVDVAALLQSLSRDLAETGVSVTMQSAAHVLYECRPTALKRAFTNLIDNAVKYGKRARVTIEEKPSVIEITVDDDGPGIPEPELTRVLEPFYRLEESRSTNTGGVGLGLAIALAAIQAHGGELALRNLSGGGLRALVRLPR
jgi:signal transduction histidine kinase